jgi:hypothetical protein
MSRPKPEFKLDAIRDPSDSFAFHSAEGGFVEHLTKSFEMTAGER